MSDLRAIETHYKGYRFRSRTEARWAVYFDAEGIRWEYEKEGFRLPSGPYLPDFWLPQVNMWAEVKGQTFSDREVQLCQELADSSDWPVLMLVGAPACQAYEAAAPRSRPWFRAGEHLTYAVCAGQYLHSEQRFFCCPGDQEEVEKIMDEALDSLTAARSARFEHGETPARPRVPREPSTAPAPARNRGRTVGETAEKAILAALLKAPGKLEWVAARVGEADFWVPEHRLVYSALLARGGQFTLTDIERDLPADAVPRLQSILDYGEVLIDITRTLEDGVQRIEGRAVERELRLIDREMPLATPAEQFALMGNARKLKEQLVQLGGGTWLMGRAKA